jgi:hypothetical protein
MGFQSFAAGVAPSRKVSGIGGAVGPRSSLTKAPGLSEKELDERVRFIVNAAIIGST